MATTTYGTPYVSGTDLVANWPAASLTVANSIDAAGYFVGRGINAQTASYQTVLTDAGKTISMTAAGATTLTIPANSSVAYVVGTRINILNLGAGACTPTAGAGVTIAGTITALATNGSASLVKTATNTWSYIAGSGAGGGKILQVVQATTTTSTVVSSLTYADSTLTATITPTSATSTILVQTNQLLRVNRGAGGAAGSSRLLRGATVIYGGTFLTEYALFTIGPTSIDLITRQNLLYLDSPATTSATTYKTQIAAENAAHTITAQYTSGQSSIILMEVGA